MKQLLILNYHHVGLPPKEARYKRLYVSKKHLRRHIRFLKNLGFEFLTLGSAMQSQAKKIACVTFDDGFVDNISEGFPTLSEENVPATVFVVTSSVGETTKQWKESGNKNISSLMNWDQLKTLKASGWEIASHCHEHVHLERKSFLEQLSLIQKSHEILSDNLRTDIVSFAYPYGSYTAESIKAVSECGFRCAVTTEVGINRDLQNPLQLKRVPLGGRHPHHLALSFAKILGALYL